MKKLNLLKTMFLLCALMVGSSVWADDEEIASGTFNGKNETYTEGWTTNGTGKGRTDCIIIGSGENITSPALDLSGYSEVTISIKARRYGSLSGSKATIDASIANSSVGTTNATGTNATTSLTSIVFKPTSSMTAVQIVFTCTNATSAGSTHGAGINSITITGTLKGDDNQVATPEISGDDSEFFETKTVTITTATEDAIIYYTLDGEDPTTSSTPYSEPFEITQTTTVKAFAVKEGLTDSHVASETFTKIDVKSNIAAFIAGRLTGQTGYVQLTNALVTYNHGTTAYIEDASGAVVLYGCAGELVAGDKINGVMHVTNYSLYQGLPEVTDYTLVDGYTKTSGNTVTPTEVTLETLFSNYTNYLSRYVVIKEATVKSGFSSKNATIEQDGNEIVLRDQNSQAILYISQGATVNVTANVAIYGETKQMAVYDQTQIEEVLANTQTLTVVSSNGTVEIAGKTLDEDGKCEIAEGASVTATATPAEHYTFTSWSANGVTLEDATENPVTFTMPTIAVTLTANFTENPSHIATFSVLGSYSDGTIYYEGEAINFPAVSAPAGYAFVGWTETEIDGTQTAAPEDLVTAAVMGNADIIYYAVFAKSSGGGSSDTYALVSDVDDLNDGDKIILVSTGSYKTGGVTHNFTVANGNVNENKLIDPVDVTISDNTVTSTDVTPITLVEVTGGWKLQIGTQYLNIVATKNNIVLDDEGAVNTISIASNVATIGGIADGSDTRYIYYNPNSGNGRFAYYKSTQKDVSIYKQEGGTTYSDYCTSIIVSATVTSAGWATYITPAAVKFAEDEAYVVTDASIAQGLALEAITEAPANTPVLLKGAGEKTFNVVASADAPAKNKLTVCDGTIEVGYYAYVLAKKGDGAAFKRWSGGIETLNGRVILPLDQAVASAREFFDLDGETTGIDAMHNAQCTMHNEVFDLQGRRVAQPTKGLYIVNGKKMVIK